MFISKGSTSHNGGVPFPLKVLSSLQPFTFIISLYVAELSPIWCIISVAMIVFRKGSNNNYSSSAPAYLSLISIYIYVGIAMEIVKNKAKQIGDVPPRCKIAEILPTSKNIWLHSSTRDTHTCCRAFGSRAVTPCFNDLCVTAQKCKYNPI